MSENIEQLFVKQLKENQNIIHKICRLYTSNEDAHKDLFQEVTIQLWKAFPKFRGESKFSTWLKTLLTMNCNSLGIMVPADFIYCLEIQWRQIETFIHTVHKNKLDANQQVCEIH